MLSIADFNIDGLVDGNDLQVWQSNFGSSVGATSNTGDADGNGYVDGQDFLLWQQNFGRQQAIDPDEVSGYVIDESAGPLEPITFAVDTGPQNILREISIAIDASFGSTPGSGTSDRVELFLVERDNPNNILLDGGDTQTPFFALEVGGAEYPQDLVRFDGEQIHIDVASVPVSIPADIYVNLVDRDGQSGTSVKFQPLENDFRGGMLVVPFTTPDTRMLTGMSEWIDGGGGFTEIGLIAFDDASGAIDGVQPGQLGYSQALADSEYRQVLYDENGGLGDICDFTIQGGPLGVYVAYPHELNCDLTDHLQVAPVVENEWEICWEESQSIFPGLPIGNGNLDDAVIRLSLTQSCPDLVLNGWGEENGGTETGRGTVNTDDCIITLIEGDSFDVDWTSTFTIPDSGALTFSYSGLSFDYSDEGFVNDAFEAALVDPDGNPLVRTIDPGRDAFFNITEGVGEQAADGVVVDGETVTVGLGGLIPGDQARIIFRLVNNDDDVTTTVRIDMLDLIDDPIQAVAPRGAGVVESVTPVGSLDGTAETSTSVTIPSDDVLSGLLPGSQTGPDLAPPHPDDTLLGDDGRVEFTTGADFERGTLFNVNTTELPGSVSLNPVDNTEIFPFIWISNSGDGTVSKFDTRTGEELGRYRTGPSSASNPSRIAVTASGDAWVANRGDSSSSPYNAIKVLQTGFIDRNGNGVIDTCQDLNNDGKITGGEILPWDANGDGQPDDERIALWVHAGRNRNNVAQWIYNGGARGIVVDADGKLWVGLYNHHQYEVFDAATGQFEKVVSVNGNPYGAVIAPNGILYSSTSNSRYLDRIDTAAQSYLGAVDVGSTMYGITVDQHGVVWMSGYTATKLIRYEPDTGAIDHYDSPIGRASGGGVTVDNNGNVWAAAYSTQYMQKWEFADDGRTLLSSKGVVVTINGITAGHTKAAAVDADGFIWTTCRSTNRAYKIDPDTDITVLTVETGNDPYNYSDMTGFVRAGAIRTGTWTEIVDAQRLGAVWASVTVAATTPDLSTMSKRVRASDDHTVLQSANWIELDGTDSLLGIVGRYLEVEIQLESTDREIDPSVESITVQAIPVPEVTIRTPTDRATLDELTTLLSGTALAGQPPAGDPSGAVNEIVAVTVDGVAVEVLDAGANFFNQVDLEPGLNRFEVAATDRFGQVGYATVTIMAGQPDLVDFSQYADITGSFDGVYGRTSLNEEQTDLYLNLAIRNDGIYDADVPLLIGVTNITDPMVSVRNPDGYTPDGVPYFNYTEVTPNGRLAPNELTEFPTITFDVPNRERFKYDLIFFGKLNQPPEIVTLPDVEALAGKVYTYDVDARDPDSDSIGYKLLSFPTDMTIDPTTGVISWSPETADIGDHNILVEATDGRGGVAEQRYTLSVIAPPPNRPPVIVSDPVTCAKASVNMPGGKIIVANDEWTLSNSGFSAIGDTAQFVRNIADYFTGGGTGSFLAYSNNFGLTGSQLASTFQAAGHEWLVSTTIDFTLEILINYDGVFVGGYAVDNQILIDYVLQGGNVYLLGGSGTTGSVGPADVEAATWRDFLNEFGLDFSSTYRNSGVIPINETPHPIFVGISTLFQDVGQPIIDLDPIDDLGVVVASLGTDGLYSIYDSTFGQNLSYKYDVEATDLDDDPLTYSLLTSPSGMWIDPDEGVIRWGPTLDQIGEHDVKVLVEDGRGGEAVQEYTVVVKGDPDFQFEETPELDLAIGDVDTTGLVFDGQTLTVSGTIAAKVTNHGPDATPSIFDVGFFEDLNGDHLYDDGVDTLLGTTTIDQRMAANEDFVVTAELSGYVQFTKAVIYAFVDSGDAIAETDETNNIARELCEFVPTVGVFDPQLEWSWTSTSVLANYLNVLTTPLIIDLDQDGYPEVVFSSTSSTGGGGIHSAVLRALDGRSGNEIFTVENSGLRISASATLAAADIDLDGFPEIIALAEQQRHLIAFEHNGDFKWLSDQIEANSNNWVAPAIADLDGDGTPEIVVGRQILSNQGIILFTGNKGRGSAGYGAHSLVADINLDGTQEIIAGYTAYDQTATELWSAGYGDGFNAIGNFDSDDNPEIVLVTGGQVILLEHTGQEKWGPVSIPGGGRGGPPTVADFDGDGEPEIGVAGASRYVVLETDGTEKWAVPVQDGSSNFTAASVFDFEGDGSAEVVYRDELRLYVFDGKTGSDLLFDPSNPTQRGIPMSSCTWHEYVPIADVDADGNAEIIAFANNSCGFGPQRGVYVFGSSSDSWVSTRQIWNQHTYHITNVNDDGTIPQHEEPSWLIHNTYRLNTLTDATSARLAPDLTASYVRAEISGDDVLTTTRIGNGGSIFVTGGVSVAYYDGDPNAGGILLGTAATSNQLNPGEFEEIQFLLPGGSAADLWVVADDDGQGRGQVSECCELNNFFHAGSAVAQLNVVPAFMSTPVLYATEGIEYQYDADAADPENDDPLTYHLVVAPSGMSIDASSGEVTWTPGGSQAGHHAVQVLVEDTQGRTAIQVFSITVADAINTPPVFVGSLPSQAVVGQRYQAILQASDLEGDSMRFELLQGPDRMTVHPNFGDVEWTPNLSQIGSHDVLLLVTDPGGASSVQSFTIEVLPFNTAPVFTSTPPSEVAEGQTIAYLATAQDAQGDTLTFEKVIGPADLAVNESTGLVEWTRSTGDTAEHQVMIRVYDDRGGEATQTFMLAVGSGSSNTAPTIDSMPRTATRLGREYIYVIKAADADFDPLTYILTSGPARMTVDSEGVVRWTPGAGDVDMAHPVEITVSDGRGGVSTQDFDLFVTQTDQNTAPLIVTPAPTWGRVDRPYVYNPVGYDAEGDPLLWQLDTAPVGMTINPRTGSIRWTPTLEQSGANDVVLRVTDAVGAGAIQEFTILSPCANVTPVISSAPLTLAVAGSDYYYAVRATDPDNDPLAFYFVNSEPTDLGMTIDGNGLVRWSPDDSHVGDHVIYIAAEDPYGAIATQQYTLVVEPALDGTGVPNHNRPPNITSTPVFAAEVDVVYNYQVVASDPDGDTLAYYLQSKPSGMDIDPQTGVITWPQPQVGDAFVAIVVEDTHGAVASQGFSIAVRDNLPPEITSDPVDQAYAGAMYRYDVVVDDPEDDVLIFTLDVAPEGMTIDQFGRILWRVPSTAADSAPVQVTVADDRGQTDTQSYTITILQDTTAPRVTILAEAAGAFVADGGSVDIGSTVVLTVLASDNVGVVSRTLSVNGAAVGLDANNQAAVQADVLGNITADASAADAEGNTGSTQLVVMVVDPATNNRPVEPDKPVEDDPTRPPHPGFDPTDNQAPIVEITSPAIGATVSDRTPITGTIDDPEDNLWYWRAYVARADRVSITNIDLSDPDYTIIAQGTDEVHDAEIATFDPSLLTNDPYTILVAAFDVNGRGWVEPTLVTVEGAVKLGEFHLAFTDLSLPLAGIPITITRVYDSREAPTVGDFGHGWTLGVQDARILEIAALGAGGGLNPGNDKFIPGKTKVYLTNPSGQRIGFTYQEELTSASLFGGVWRPYFEPDPGVYDTLTIDETQVARGGIVGALAQGINPNNYTLTTKEGVKYRYNQSTGLEKITDRNGNTVTFTEDGVHHSSGVSIDFVRDSRGRIIEIHDTNGGVIRYEYDVAGDLVAFSNQIDSESGMPTYTYNYLDNPAHFLEEIFDADGVRLFKAEFDENGRLSSSTDALGNVVEQDFDLEARTGTITDARGNVTTLIYDERGNVTEEQSSPVVNPITGATVQYTKTYEYTDTRHPDKETKIVEYDGTIVEYKYDAAGNTIRTTQTSADGSQSVFTSISYDANSNLTSLTSPNSGTTTLSYSSNNPTSVTSPLGDIATITYNALGKQETFTDFNGHTTTYEYLDGCPCGTPKTVTHADGSYEVREWNRNAQITRVAYYEADGTLVYVTTTDYDRLGRKIRETVGEGASEIVTTYAYNGSTENVTRETIVHPTDPSQNRVTYYFYNDAGNLVRQVDPDLDVNDPSAGIFFKYDASGNRVWLMDPVGNVTTWIYDSLDRVIEERDPLYWAGTDWASISDAQILALIGTPTPVETAPFDPSHITRFAYDGAGNVIEEIDRNGRRRTFEYDYRGNLLEEIWYDTTDDVTVIRAMTFTYDTAGNMLTAVDPDAEYVFTYDTMNRLKTMSVDHPWATNFDTFTLTYEYDAMGNVVSATDSLDVSVKSEYDNRNRLASRWWEGASVDNIRADFEYTAAGQLARINRWANSDRTNSAGSTDYLHNLAGRIQGITHRKATDEVLARYEYDFDFAGLITQEVLDHITNEYDRTSDYTYDAHGQLLSAIYDNSQEDETFTYDANGNRTLPGYVTGPGNQLLSDGTYNYTYDAEGNMVTKTRINPVDGEVNYTEYEYDFRNRMTRVTQYSKAPSEGGIILHEESYRYDALGRRIQVVSDGEETICVYDGRSFTANEWTRFDAGGEVSQRFLFTDRVDQLIAQWTRGEGVTWALTDQLGSIRDMINNAGQIVQDIQYAAFGLPTFSTSIGNAHPFAFTGRIWDSLLGMSFNRARFYDVQSGRFVTRDPIGFAAGQYNFFTYGSNDPILMTDPTGEIGIVAYAFIILFVTSAVTAGSCYIETDNETIQTIADTICPVSLVRDVWQRVIDGIAPAFGTDPFNLPGGSG